MIHTDNIPDDNPEQFSLLEQYAVNWSTFWETTDDFQWLYEPVILKGKNHLLFADVEGGKSFWLLDACLTMLREHENLYVIYVDDEMARNDLKSRLSAFGVSEPRPELARFNYLVKPNLGSLDQPLGAGRVLRMVREIETVNPAAHVVVVLDTIGMMVAGPNDKDDTWGDLWRELESHLVERHTVIRLDHVGWSEKQRVKGASGKRSKIDLSWGISHVGNLWTLKADKARQFPDQAKEVVYVFEPEQFTFFRVHDTAAAKINRIASDPRAIELARRFDDAGVELGTTQRYIFEDARARGLSFDDNVARDAVKLLKSSEWSRIKSEVDG